MTFKRFLLLLLAGGLAPAALAQVVYRSGAAPQDYQVVYRREAAPPAAPPAAGAPAPGAAGPAPAPAPAPANALDLLFPGLAQGGAGTAPSSAPGAVPAAAVPDGLFFKARFVSGLLAPIGLTTPVLAEAEEGWCGKGAGQPCGRLVLLGTATLTTTGRAMVVFERAVTPQGLAQVRAVAFDAADLLYGLRGEVMDIAPSLAADLLRAAFGGLSDWVKALTEATTVTLTQNGTVSSRQAGPFWAYALGRAGQAVTVPADASALVRAVVVSAGTPLMVLTGYAPGDGEAR